MAQVVPVAVAVVAAPASQAIDRLFAGPTLLVKQHRKGCLREIVGCEDTSEFSLATKENHNIDTMHALEESNCGARVCLPQNRPLKLTVRENDKDGPVVLRMDFPFHCFQACCFIPKLTVTDDSQATVYGKTTQPFICCQCVPELHVFDGTDQLKYKVHMAKCCGGMCVDCFHKVDGQGGCCSCKVPFPIWDLEGNEVGNIMKEWRGLGTEALSHANTFSIKFPEGIDTGLKASLLGTTFMLDYFMFEKGGQGN